MVISFFFPCISSTVLVQLNSSSTVSAKIILSSSSFLTHVCPFTLMSDLQHHLYDDEFIPIGAQIYLNLPCVRRNELTRISFLCYCLLWLWHLLFLSSLHSLKHLICSISFHVWMFRRSSLIKFCAGVSFCLPGFVWFFVNHGALVIFC